MPAIKFNKVVLPDPDGPMSERNSPLGTSSDRLFRGVIVVFPLENDLVIDRIEINESDDFDIVKFIFE